MVKGLYKGAEKRVKNSIEKHQRSALSFLLFITLLDDPLKEKLAEEPRCLLVADDIVLVHDTVKELSANIDALTSAIKEKGL